MRNKILRALRNKRDGYISGTKLAKSLQTSRVAIWKHVQALKKEGYKIESLPKVGYRLISVPDILLPLEIKDGLDANFFGKKVYHYDRVNSTQEVAKELASKGAREGTLVIAETQTRGKGRRGRSWYSLTGGVFLSIILRPKMSPSQAPLMSLLGGVAVAKTIRELYKLKAELKWPNDIQIDDKKVGGILTELAADAELINWVVMGIGLNANIRVASLPHELRVTATSLKEECNRDISRVELVKKLLENLEQLYLIFKRRGEAPILEEWKNMTNTLRAWVRVENGEAIEGRALDIDRDGALIIELASGITKRIIAGDVSLRKDKLQKGKEPRV